MKEGRDGGIELGSDLDLDSWQLQYYGSGSGLMMRTLRIRIRNTVSKFKDKRQKYSQILYTGICLTLAISRIFCNNVVFALGEIFSWSDLLSGEGRLENSSLFYGAYIEQNGTQARGRNMFENSISHQLFRDFFLYEKLANFENNC